MLRVCCDARVHMLQGTFFIFLADTPASGAVIPHNSFVKVCVTSSSGETLFRMPAWVRYAELVPERNEYCGKYWDPPAPERHTFAHPRPSIVLQSGNIPARYGCKPFESAAAASPVVFDHSLRIYEAHVGMASAEERVGTYVEFARDVLPRVKKLGYNCVQVRSIILL